MQNNSQLSPKMLVAEVALLLNTSVQNIHKKIKDKKLPIKKSQNRVYFGHAAAKEIFDFNIEPKVFSFQLVKGGVGKTAISFNFAVRSALIGAKVAIIELDQQSNLTRTFGVDHSETPVMIDIVKERLNIEDHLVNVSEGIDILPSRVDNALLDNVLMLEKHPLDKVFRRPIQHLKKKYDVIIIDCPPSISAAVSAAALASDVIVMPVNPTDYAVAGLELTHKELKDLFEQYELQSELKILFNKYDGRTSMSFNIMEELIKHPEYGPLLIQSYIRSSQGIENYISEGKSVFDTVKQTNEREDFSIVSQILLGIS